MGHVAAAWCVRMPPKPFDSRAVAAGANSLSRQSSSSSDISPQSKKESPQDANLTDEDEDDEVAVEIIDPRKKPVRSAVAESPRESSQERRPSAQSPEKHEKASQRPSVQSPQKREEASSPKEIPRSTKQYPLQQVPIEKKVDEEEVDVEIPLKARRKPAITREKERAREEPPKPILSYKIQERAREEPPKPVPPKKPPPAREVQRAPEQPSKPRVVYEDEVEVEIPPKRGKCLFVFTAFATAPPSVCSQKSEVGRIDL
ncbi:hypothetical protein COOONC_03729 [Cooperia oncophora]